jgi:preprotein translocase subunit SecE
VNEQKKVMQQQAGGDFVRSVITELRRVTWPTRNEWVSATVLTLGLVVVLGLLTWLLDLGFGSLFDFLHVKNI